MKKPTVSGRATGRPLTLHAALSGQGKPSHFLEQGWRREKKAWRAKDKTQEKKAAFCQHEWFHSQVKCSGHAFRVGTLSRFKGLGLIAGLCGPHAIDVG